VVKEQPSEAVAVSPPPILWNGPKTAESTEPRA
jgi:hypothetical protein